MADINVCKENLTTAPEYAGHRKYSKDGKNEYLIRWCKSHKIVFDTLDDYAIAIAKGKFNKDAKIKTSLVNQILENLGISIKTEPFRSKDILYAWQNYL